MLGLRLLLVSLVVWLQHQQKQHNQQHQQSKQHQQPMHQLNQHQQSKQHQQHMHQLNQNEQSKQHHQHMHQHRQSQQHMHQHKQPAPATISTSNTSSRAGQQRQQHQRSSVKQQQDQNGNTENTNMISKMQQKPSARPKKYQNLVYCRLGESGFCYSPQRARALASTFQGTLRLNQRTSICYYRPVLHAISIASSLRLQVWLKAPSQAGCYSSRRALSSKFHVLSDRLRERPSGCEVRSWDNLEMLVNVANICKLIFL